ncbi:hypothetical protein EUBSIR_01666 [[Eubacterium] siraeum DSM 15702]|uniref:Uncharacterized protein n=1 Tax=[Eubacterium] siraeum DSM 15702 TaxID=428128 RepID=B0MPA7_9FIRM|nr:hypothetical protein EUBSIR_01666 [[Eubacterium] siraeum DSM 15702]
MQVHTSIITIPIVYPDSPCCNSTVSTEFSTFFVYYNLFT